MMPSTTSGNKLEARVTWSFSAIGTQWQIDTPTTLSDTDKKEILAYCESFDLFFSRFRKDSAVWQLGQKAGSITIPQEWLPLVQFYTALAECTKGQFTACVGTSLAAAGYDEQYSLQPKEVPAVPSWNDIVSLDGAILTVAQPVLLDFGAAGKGFLVDCLVQKLLKREVKTGTIDASGDIYTWGEYKELVGLENPLDTQKVVGVVPLQNRALCASATNRRAWAGGWHHIVNPARNKSVDDVRATWVTADSAMHADGIATALFVCEPEVLKQLVDFNYIRMHSNGLLDYSDNFKRYLHI